MNKHDSFKSPTPSFLNLVNKITKTGYEWHKSKLIDQAKSNLPRITKSTKDLKPLTGKKAEKALVISAGPSVKKTSAIERIKNSNFEGTLIAVDFSYISCLKQGLIPDFVITLDPHSTRLVRLFGDPDFEIHKVNDDYFDRQDLDTEFRNNSIKQNEENIELVNKFGSKSSLLISSTTASNVVDRIRAAGMDDFWYNPLVDNPKNCDSITRQLYDSNKLPCMNTGGTVGTAAWVFASEILNVGKIGLIGTDMGYYENLPIEKTQTYYELLDMYGNKEEVKKYFNKMAFPLTGDTFYTDPTYYWYRENFLHLLKSANKNVWNCSEAGIFFGEHVKCIYLDKFFEMN